MLFLTVYLINNKEQNIYILKIIVKLFDQHLTFNYVVLAIIAEDFV
jgi:hypothetical protein